MSSIKKGGNKQKGKRDQVDLKNTNFLAAKWTKKKKEPIEEDVISIVYTYALY
jgi:hypothetical protein